MTFSMRNFLIARSTSQLRQDQQQECRGVLDFELKENVASSPSIANVRGLERSVVMGEGK